MAVLGSCLHRIRASLHIIAQGFGFTRDFLKERNNSAYCRLKKIPCGFKEQARTRHPGEKCGLVMKACCWMSFGVGFWCGVGVVLLSFFGLS
jgi:hypothetical protein